GRGAVVTLVAGATSLEPPERVNVVRVSTAAEMERAMLEAAADADVVVMAAAVADYPPARAAGEKLARTDEPRTLALEPTADILAQLGRARRQGQVLVGFALETTRDVARARAKLSAKGLDLVVLNTAAEGIGGETNRVTLVEAGAERELPPPPQRAGAGGSLGGRAQPPRAGGAKPRRRRRPPGG